MYIYALIGFPSFLVFAEPENLGHREVPKSNNKLHWQGNPEMTTPGEKGAALIYFSVVFMIFLVPGDTKACKKTEGRDLKEKQ